MTPQSITKLQHQRISSAVFHHPQSGVAIIKQQHTVCPASAFEEHWQWQLQLQQPQKECIKAVIDPAHTTATHPRTHAVGMGEPYTAGRVPTLATTVNDMPAVPGVSGPIPIHADALSQVCFGLGCSRLCWLLYLITTVAAGVLGFHCAGDQRAGRAAAPQHNLVQQHNMTRMYSTPTWWDSSPSKDLRPAAAGPANQS